MLLLRWTLLDDFSTWSYYDLEDVPQEQSDEDWISPQWDDDFISVYYTDEDSRDDTDDDLVVFYFEDDQVGTVYPDEDIREEYDEEWIYRLDDQVYDTDQLLVIVDDDERIDYEDDWFDAYGNVDIPPPPPDVSEQIFIVFLDDDPREEYDDGSWDPYGQIDPPPVVIVCPLVPDDINAAIYYVARDGAFYDARDCAFYIAGLLQTATGGRQITEEEVEAEEFEFLKKIDYPETLRFKDSTNIETVRYNKTTGEMQIKFKTGGTYKYEDVAPGKFKGIGKAKSAGTYFHNKIKPKHPGKKL